MFKLRSASWSAAQYNQRLVGSVFPLMLWQGKAWGWERTGMEMDKQDKRFTIWNGIYRKRLDCMEGGIHRYGKHVDEDWGGGKNSEEIGKKRRAELSSSFRWCLNLISSSRKEKSLISPQDKETLQTRKVFIFLLESRLSSARQNSKKEEQRNACSKVYTCRVYVTYSTKCEEVK